MSDGLSLARLKAQAKINLFLVVGEPDPSGYHDLVTLFQRIDLADDVVVHAGGSGRTIRCDGPAMPGTGLGRDEDNIAFRAALAYADRTGWPEGFAIDVTKHIPVGGGLGGGSADAAAVLRALDALAPSSRVLGEAALMELARGLGADIAFLVSTRVVALAAGRGDQLLPPEAGGFDLEPRDVLLVIPPFSVPTADAYRWLDADRRVAPRAWRRIIAPNSGWDIAELVSGEFGNDFEPVIERRHPALLEYRTRLQQLGARIARLSGSGSTVFGIFDGPLPEAAELPKDVVTVATRTSARVVQVEAQK